jgi:hypothetical protein
VAAGTALAALLAAITLPVVGGRYARQRLAQAPQDLALRQAHWADGLALRDDSLATAWIGMGLGRYPQAHYWRSAEAMHAASYSLAREGETRFLRLGQGATLYIEQIVPRSEPGTLRLSLDWRGGAGQPAPQVALCEKWTLSSLDCVSVVAPATVARPAAAAAAASTASAVSAASAGGWQRQEWLLDASRLLARPAPWRAPLKLSLLTPQQGAVDLTRLSLRTAGGDELLANGDFVHGLDRWFFATDVDPPWQLHSLPLAVLFDQGWLGVLAWSAVVLLALGGGGLALWQGQALLPAALPAVLGFAVSGALNTLIDAPRFLWLLLLLLWLAAARRPANRVGLLHGAPGGAP